MGLQIQSTGSTGNINGSATDTARKLDVTNTNTSQLVSSTGSNPITVTWTANATSITLNNFTSGQTISGRWHFRYNNVNYHFDADQVSGTGTSRTVRNIPVYDIDGQIHASPWSSVPSGRSPLNKALDKRLDTSTASSGTIHVFQTDTLETLATAIATHSQFTSTTTTNNANRTINITYSGTERVIINCVARIADEESGVCTVNIINSSSGRAFLQLCGYTTTSGQGPKVVLGKTENGVQTGTVQIVHNAHPTGVGSLKPSDDGVNQSTAALKPDNDTGNHGYTKYYMFMGLGGSDDWFYTNHVTNAVACEWIWNVGSDGRRYDIDTWDGGMTGDVAISVVGMAPGWFAHITSGGWDISTFVSGVRNTETKFLDIVNSEPVPDEVVGTDVWAFPRVYPTSSETVAIGQRVDFNCFDVNNLQDEVNVVYYDYPFNTFRQLRIGSTSGSTSNQTHSIVYTPTGRKPGNNVMAVNRARHGAQGAGGNFIYSVGVEPTTQSIGGVGHSIGWMMYDRTYLGLQSTTTTGTGNTAGSTTLTVASTAGFPATGTLTNTANGDTITYTAIASSTTFTVPATGGGAIGTTIPAGTEIRPQAAFSFSDYANNANALAITGTSASTGRGDTRGSLNPDLVHIDSADQGSVRGSTTFGRYMVELDASGKNGIVLPYGISAGGNSATDPDNPTEYYYQGTYTLYVGAPGRPTIEQEYQVIDTNNVLSNINQTPVISHDLHPNLTLNSSGVLNDVQTVELNGEAVTGEYLTLSQNHRAWTIENTTNPFTGNQLCATVSNIPYLIATTWSGKARGTGASPAAGSKYSRWNAYRNNTGFFARVAEFEGDYIESASSDKFTIKTPVSTPVEITISGTDIPVQSSGGYTTVDISSGGSSPTRGTWDLNGNGLECDASSNPHMFLQGIITGLETFSSLSAAQATGAFSIKGHDRMDGNVEVEVEGSSPVYISFVDCALATGASMVINKASGSGSGELRVVNPPAGATEGTGVSFVQQITITRPALTGETSAATVKGLLSVYNGSSLVTSFAASGTGVSVASGTVSYTTNSTLGVSVPATGTLRIVWSGAGGADFETSVTKTSGENTYAITVASAAESTATSLPTGFAFGFSTSNATTYTATAEGAYGSGLPSTAQTWYGLDTQVRGTSDYNNYIRMGTGSANLNVVSNNTNYATANGDKFKITVASDDNNSQSIGHIENAAGAANIGVNRTPLGGATYYMSIAPDPPGVNAGSFAAAMTAADIATNTDLTEARNAIFGKINTI